MSEIKLPQMGEREKDGRIDITGIDKAELLAGLYNASKVEPRAVNWFPNGMTCDDANHIQEVRSELAATNEYGELLNYFNLKGQNIKLDLHGDELDPASYDFHNGSGAAAAVVAGIREKGML